jgi:hypothetical protein
MLRGDSSIDWSSWADRAVPVVERVVAGDQRRCVSVSFGSDSTGQTQLRDGRRVLASICIDFAQRLADQRVVQTRLGHLPVQAAGRRHPGPARRAAPVPATCRAPGTLVVTRSPTDDRCASRIDRFGRLLFKPA